MVKHPSIRVILDITVVQDIELDQLDVKTTFLHGRLEEEILCPSLKGMFSLVKKTIYVS